MPFLSQHKYKLVLMALLGSATIVAILLEQGRAVYTRVNEFPSLVWNLCLAWIPFVVAFIAYVASWSRPMLYLIVPLCIFIWLLFFPNAPYMLTEFQHLRTDAATAPLWFDVLLLIWFAWIGLLLGVTSLYLIQEIVTRVFGTLIGWLFALGMMILGGVGIYLGRFLRWNSWDLLQDPLPIARDFLTCFRYPTLHLKAYTFIFLFTILFLFVYLMFHTFGHMMMERQSR